MPSLALGVSSLADALTVISVELGEGHFLIQEEHQCPFPSYREVSLATWTHDGWRRAFEHLQSWMASRVTTFVEKQPRLKSQSNVAELLAILNDDNNEENFWHCIAQIDGLYWVVTPSMYARDPHMWFVDSSGKLMTRCRGMFCSELMGLATEMLAKNERF